MAGLIRVTGDWDLAEDCFQDAAERALARWPADGVPDNPAAWLTTTAYRRALDVLRRRRTETAKLREVARLAQLDLSDSGPDADPYGDIFRDDRLRLIFTCCHPALPLAGRVALTLKTVAGLSTREVARAFLVSEATMGQRLLRTKSKIANAGIRFAVPEPHRLAERTQGVLAVIYLVFNAGYAVTQGDGSRNDWVSGAPATGTHRGACGVAPPHGNGPRHDLATQAVRLAERLVRLLPGDDEVQSLHALLLLQHARREARFDADGDLVPMEEQERSRWDRPMAAAGLASLAAVRTSDSPPGPYRLQAEIAAVHATAASAAETDWARVVSRYDALLAIQPSPVVALNRAVAIGFRDGPVAGLAELAEVGPDALRGYHLLPAVRADLLRRAGENEQALVAYRDALTLMPSAAERRFLERRIREILD